MTDEAAAESACGGSTSRYGTPQHTELHGLICALLAERLLLRGD